MSSLADLTPGMIGFGPLAYPGQAADAAALARALLEMPGAQWLWP